MNEVLVHLPWFAGLLLLGTAVLAGSFTLLLQTIRWNWPAPLRWVAALALLSGYCLWLFREIDSYWPYRLAAILLPCLVWRLPHGFAKTFLPSFIASFKAAQERSKNRR